MIYHDQSEDYRPLFWLQGRPIYANTLMVGLQVGAFVAAALCIATLGLEPVVNALALEPFYVWHGQLWRLASYVAFDDRFFGQGALWFIISIAMLYFFGREVEQFVGRSTYLKTYAALIIVPAVVVCLASFVWPVGAILDSGDLFLGMFAAFATIYPGVIPSSWVPLSARAILLIILAVRTVLDLADHQFIGILMVWSCAATGFLCMRLVGGGHGMNWLTDWLEARRSERLARKHQIRVVREQKTAESIDAVLEKISRQGVGSLTAAERATLERARTQLLKRDQR